MEETKCSVFYEKRLQVSVPLASSCICLHRDSLCVQWLDFIFKLRAATVLSEL